MTDRVQIVSPIDGRVYAERKVATGAEIDAAVAKTRRAREVSSGVWPTRRSSRRTRPRYTFTA